MSPPLPSTRIDIILPRYYNNRKKIPIKKFLDTKREFADKFSFCTFLKPTLGDWIDPETGNEYPDEENTGMFVVVPKERTEDAMQFMEVYKPRLKKRFRQKEIFIICSEVVRI